jgi:magnesium transporter
MKGEEMMRRKVKTSGHPPGTMVFTGEKKVENVRITVLEYGESFSKEREVQSIEECVPEKKKSSVYWINVGGLHDIRLIEDLGERFGLHPLVLEDIVNIDQRPKVDEFEEYLFVVLKMITYRNDAGKIDTEQVSLVVGNNFVISFQEREGDVFGQIRERIHMAKGRIRKMGADYLAYSLVDAIVDHYFEVLEKTGEQLESLEEELLSNPRSETSARIHGIKRDLISLRKSVWPLREIIGNLERGESGIMKSATLVFLRDVYDHTIQVIDTLETYRDTISGLLDVYLSSISNRMNEVMKVLTIIATIFIPLTFIAGIYGMNFQRMPELGWRWGYFAVLIVMGCIGAVMVIFFKKKRWL